MGHTSKFTFPLPGRKPKSSQFHSNPALSKVQKILGTGEIVADKPAPSGQDRPWGNRSNSLVSGISISVSESTTSPSEHGTGLGIIDDATEVASTVRGAARSQRWEEESGVMPPASRAGFVGADGFDDRMTDASSLHRRQSNSTITSYYDKTKLPLSISQQTSSSAMAKGLPHKAKALLDMEGSSPVPKPKKKPAKLDLSHLMPKSRLSRYSIQEVQPQKPLVLGPDLMTRSPSVMSVSPDITPPLLQQRSDRPAGKRSARETLKALLPTVTESSPSHRAQSSHRQQELLLEASGLGTPSRSSLNLHNLYEHYEQRTMQDAMEEAPDAGKLPINSKHRPISPNHLPQFQDHASLASPTSPGPRGFLSPFARITQRGSRSSRQLPPSTTPIRSSSPMTVSTTRTESPSKAALAARQLKSGSPDCGASISSRHTRTSQASRRTDRSMNDLDLQLNSVLSLSSDSEDDMVESDYKPELPTVNNTVARTVSLPARSRVAGVADGGARAPGSHGTNGAGSIHDLFPVPERSAQPPCPPKIAERTSSLPTVPTLSKHTGSLRSGHRPSSAKRASGIVQSMHQRPASRGSLVSIPETSLPTRKAHDARASLQPTPPLSPANLEFHRSEYRPASSVDARSTHSGRSASAASMRSKQEVAEWDDTSDGRFMAVTRQEEMLLAALRQKRAQIRETIIAELEEEQERGSGEHGLPYASSRLSRDQTASMSRHSSRSTIRGYEAEHSRPQVLRSKGSRTSLASAQGRRIAELDSIDSDRGQILLMLDRPAGDVDDMDAAEPSPDLSDFLDFDDNSDKYLATRISDRSDVDGRSVTSVSGPGSSSASRSVASLSGPSSSTASRSTSSHGRGRASLSAIASNHFDNTRAATNGGFSPAIAPLHAKNFSKTLPDVDHVKILEDPLEGMVFPDVPRPDSPISPAEGTWRLTSSAAPKKGREARLSAVGQYTPHAEVGWWDDDG